MLCLGVRAQERGGSFLNACRHPMLWERAVCVECHDHFLGMADGDGGGWCS